MLFLLASIPCPHRGSGVFYFSHFRLLFPERHQTPSPLQFDTPPSDPMGAVKPKSDFSMPQSPTQGQSSAAHAELDGKVLWLF